MLWGFVFRLILLSPQRLHRTWKQDIYHRACVWRWHRSSLHLPSGRAQTDPRNMRPQLQHVLSWKPHWKPLQVLPHKGEIITGFFFFITVSLDKATKGYIIGLQFFTIKRVWRLGRSLNWSKINGRLTKMSILASILVWMSSLRVLPWVWHSFYQRWEHRVKGSCRRFGQCFALSRCSIHLPLFPSIKNSVWLREWNLPIYST